MPMGKDRTFALKAALTLALLAAWLLPVPVEAVAAGARSPWHAHFACQWFHANVWHLAGNLYVMWLMRFSLRGIAAAYAISVAATFAAVRGGAAGFSSVLYALMGMKAPRARMAGWQWAAFIAANAATAFLPGVAFGVHLAAFALGAACRAAYDIYNNGYRRTCRRKQEAA